MLKQSGMEDDPSDRKVDKSQYLVRYPNQYDEKSATRSDVDESEISRFVNRAASSTRIESGNPKPVRVNCMNNNMCDTNKPSEDCPQGQCKDKYMNKKYPNILDVNELDLAKKVFYDNMKELISTKATNPLLEEVKQIRNPEKDLLDELLHKKSFPCDYNYNRVEAQDQIKVPQTGGTCSNSNPNGCDVVLPNIDCPNRECYKKYLNEEPLSKYVSQTQPSGIARAKQQIEGEAFMATTGEFKKKYHTLVVNSDVVVPDFIDVLVVISETPVKIILPNLQGPTIESTVGKVSSTSNLLIKNLSLCSHQIISNEKNKIDTVRTSITVEPAGKKTFGAIHNSWILL
jgi:hypothetical protein